MITTQYNELFINKNDVLITTNFSLFVNITRVFEDAPDEHRDIKIRWVNVQNRYVFVDFDAYYLVLNSGFKDFVDMKEIRSMRKFNVLYNIMYNY